MDVLRLVLELSLIGAIAALFSTRRRSAPTPHGPWTVVDLTQPLMPTLPIWPGDPAFEVQPWASYETHGYVTQRLSIGEHSGTHWATPNTFIPGGRSADQVAASDLVLPAVVMDMRIAVNQNPDYQLSLADIQAWEQQHGPIAPRSLVILWTGWQTRWTNPTAFFNCDDQGIMHTPGFSSAVVAFLIGDRHICAIGTDTHGIDAGTDRDYGASAAIYAANGLVLECLGHLDQLPAVGATIVIGGLPIPGGSGSPARVLALIAP